MFYYTQWSVVIKCQTNQTSNITQGLVYK